MALRTIITEGDPVLAKVCRPVEKFDERLHVLLDDMRDTLAESNGVGLAAPQVGILRRVALVMDDEEEECEEESPAVPFVEEQAEEESPTEQSTQFEQPAEVAEPVVEPVQPAAEPVVEVINTPAESVEKQECVA